MIKAVSCILSAGFALALCMHAAAQPNESPTKKPKQPRTSDTSASEQQPKDQTSLRKSSRTKNETGKKRSTPERPQKSEADPVHEEPLPVKTARSSNPPSPTPDGSATPPAASDTPTTGTPTAPPEAPNATIAPEELVEYRTQPAAVRKLIDLSLELARQNLGYTFGSADPANGGFDCSGFVYFVLIKQGLTDVPRDSTGLYLWTHKAHTFRAVISRKPDGVEMDELLPGDLLFWTGTYAAGHDPPITHTMIYLGTEKSTGAKVMIGASNGRTYRSLRRNGLSVFDFIMPRTPLGSDPRATFIGYAHIPGLRPGLRE